ncbi:MAG: bifunctional homocysteine S-methyltransferase/methylenetetrahydrofolate reductase [Myxococcota bacterium]
MKAPFLDELARRPIVFDGAMGTQLYERGIYINRTFDDANLSRGDLVRQVHEDYFAAGAEVLTANTFSANRIKLTKHGLDDKIVEINEAAVRLARQVAGDAVYVAGSIGPTGVTPAIATEAELAVLRDAYIEQATLLAGAGCDLIILETFRQLSEIHIALDAVHHATDLPVIAQVAFDADRKTGEGAGPERALTLLAEWGADVIGANCMEGPHLLYDVVKALVGHDIPVIVQPNAGYPRRVDDRLVYMATPEYFGKYARRFFQLGAAAVGGCCGTGPEHVRRIAGAARMMGGGRSVIAALPRTTSGEDAVRREPIPVGERSSFSAKIERIWRERVKAPAKSRPPVSPETFAVSVEVNPPKGLDPSKALAAAKMLRAGGVDVINIADGPRASVRMSNWAMARRVMDEVDMEVILHVCGRDRNLLGIQADILAYHELGLHNLVVITGDPPNVGNYPHATAVFDLDSIGILKLVHGFNHGVDPTGKDIKAVTSFYTACGAEPAARDYERELRRLEQKKAAGATMIMTQPVYDPRVLERFLKDTEGFELPVLVGLLPLASHGNAEFLHNEVPGMSVPQDVRARMESASAQSKDVARREGVLIAQEALLEVSDRVVGAYIMPPFGRYSAALDVLECVGYPSPRESIVALQS